jgi:hypothetical protein
MKEVVTTFFDIEGTVNFEFIPQGQTVNQAYYLEIPKPLCEAMHRKRPTVWPSDWILHHDNALAHKALSVKQFWPKNQLLKWNTHHIRLIWLQMTFGCLKNKCAAKG